MKFRNNHPIIISNKCKIDLNIMAEGDTCQMSPLLFESDSEDWSANTKLPDTMSNEPTDTPIPNNQELFQILARLRQKNSTHETPKLFGRKRNFSQPLLELLADKSTPNRPHSSPYLKLTHPKDFQSQISQHRQTLRQLSKIHFRRTIFV